MKKRNLGIFLGFVLACGSVSANEWGQSVTIDAGNTRVRTSDGAECQISANTGKQLSMGTYKKDATSYGQNDSVGVYIGVVMQFGSSGQSNINCLEMYYNQNERDRLELDLLREEISLLKVQRDLLLKGETPFEAGSDW